MYLFDNPMMVGGKGVFTPIQSRGDELYGLRLMASQLIKTAIREITQPEYKQSSLRWVNAVNEDSVTSFNTACELIDKDAGYLRDRINRYAASGENISHYQLKTRSKRKVLPGRKKDKHCQMPGCTEMTAGKFCQRCKRVFYSRRHTHPNHPEYWNLPIQKKGGGGLTLAELASQVYGRSTAGL